MFSASGTLASNVPFANLLLAAACHPKDNVEVVFDLTHADTFLRKYPLPLCSDVMFDLAKAIGIYVPSISDGDTKGNKYHLEISFVRMMPSSSVGGNKEPSPHVDCKNDVAIIHHQALSGLREGEIAHCLWVLVPSDF